MKIKNSLGMKSFQSINILFMLVIAFITAYPMVHVILASFSSGSSILAHSGLLLFPLDFTTAAYKLVFKEPSLISGYLNTLFVVVFGVIINMLVTILAAYTLSRKNVRFSKPIMLYIIITMFFSGGIIPFYFSVRDLGLDGSRWALIIPSMVNTFNLIVMRTYFLSLPDALEEAAKIDGAGHLTILFRIVVPLSMPVISVILLYYSVEKWNAWFHAVLFIREKSLYPLQIVLREILLTEGSAGMAADVGSADQVSVSESIKYAVIAVATVPILCLYPFLQKYFEKGVMIGAVKE